MANLVQCFLDPVTGKLYQSVQEEPKGQLVSQVSRGDPKVSKPKEPVSKPVKRPQSKRQVRYIDEESGSEHSSDQESEQEQRPAARGRPKKQSKPQRRQSAWTEHCKDYAARNGVSYAAAVSDPKCQEEYRSGK